MNGSGQIADLLEEKRQEIYYSIEDYLYDIESTEATAQYLDIYMYLEQHLNSWLHIEESNFLYIY